MIMEYTFRKAVENNLIHRGLKFISVLLEFILFPGSQINTEIEKINLQRIKNEY